jgi:RNA polymerase sigma-70 factor (ECF subfamily)
MRNREGSGILGSARLPKGQGSSFADEPRHMWRDTNRDRFESIVLPHLDAAYNLARWLTRNDQDAQDMAQEAYLRALKFFGGFQGGDARSWLLRIVRNTCYTWLKQNRSYEAATEFNEELHGATDEAATPEAILMLEVDRITLLSAIDQLPAEWRETLVLRELEGLSYREIAEVTDAPMGTVMSRLARARGRLEAILTAGARQPRRKEAGDGV